MCDYHHHHHNHRHQYHYHYDHHTYTYTRTTFAARAGQSRPTIEGGRRPAFWSQHFMVVVEIFRKCLLDVVEHIAWMDVEKIMCDVAKQTTR